MPRKKKHTITKKGSVYWHLSSLEATRLSNPRYSGFVCGHGAHGDAKYNRAREKRKWKKEDLAD